MRTRAAIPWVLTGVLGMVGVVAFALSLLAVDNPRYGTAPPGTRVTVAPPSAGPVASGAPRARLPYRKDGDGWAVPDAKPKELTAAVAGRYVRRLRDDTVRLLRRASPGLRTHAGAAVPQQDDSFCDPGKKPATATVSGAVPRVRPDALPWALWDSWRAVPGVEPELDDGHDAHIALNSRGAPDRGTAGTYRVRVTQADGSVTVAVTGPCL